MWSGSTDPEIIFDLQGKYALNNIEIWQDPAYDFEAVTCYLSQDGNSWSEIGIFNSDGLKRVHIDLRNHSARKIKLCFANTAGSSYAYLAEIQIWGTPFEESLMDWVDDFEYSGSPEDYGWQIFDGGGTLSTEYDDFLKSNVMRVNSSDGYYFGIKRIPTDVPEVSYADLEKRYLSYTFKSGGDVWVYVLVSGDDDQWYYLVYRPSDPVGFSHISGMNVYYNLSTAYDSNQNWNTISRDLEKDLFAATGHHLKNVDLVLIRGGNYCLDDLTFSSSAPPTLGWSLVKDGFHTANGSMLKVMDYELGCEAIKVHSDDGNLFAIRNTIENGINKKWAHFNYLKATSNWGVDFRVLVKGTDDIYYYLAYISGTGGMYIGDTNGRTAYHCLGEDNRKWVDVYRDLDRDLYAAFGVCVQEVVNVLTQGGRHYLNLVEFSEEPFNEIQIPLNYGWSILQGEGTVESVHDTDLQSQVMRVDSADGWNFQIWGPQINAGYLEKDARYLSFMIKMGGYTWIDAVVYGEDDLQYYLTYRPNDGECTVSGDGTRIYHNIGSDLQNNKWHYIMRDLDRDLMEGVGVGVKAVRCFAMRGGGYSLDNLTLYKEEPSKVSVSLAAGDWYSQPDPYSGDGEFTNYYSSELGTQVLQIISASGENWNCLSVYPTLGYLDITKKYAKLNLKSNLGVGVKFCIQDLDGQYYYINYITGDGVDSISGSGTSVQIFLGAEFSDGNWHGISFNLEKDLYEKFGRHLKKTVKVQIHGGNVEIANFRFMNKVELITSVNLVGYWQLDEGSGTIAKDSSGRGNDGIIGGAQWVDGKVGKALSFDGIDDYVDCGDDESLKLSKITIEAWVYSPTSDFAGIHEIAGAEGAYGLTIWDNKLRAHLNTSEGWHWCSPSSSLSWDGWHHIALTYDGINTVRYYKDGDLILTDIATSSGSLQWASWTEYLYIGQVSNGTNLFNGIIDEVRIYNRSLTAQEIAENYGM